MQDQFILENERFFNNYAKIIIHHGLNLQKGQDLLIKSEIVHREFIDIIAREAYKAGARFVEVDFIDPRIGRARLDFKERKEDLEYVPLYVPVKYNELLDNHGCILSVLGSEEPDLFEDVPPNKINTTRVAVRSALKRFYDEGIEQSRVHWTIVGAATEGWARKIFKEENNVKERLWREIFKLTRCDNDNCLAVWREHNKKLKKRARFLTDMCIKDLHFKGPGTDLRVQLSEKAVFKGGSECGPLGVEFEPNIPTEEVFTAPDYRKTEGYVRVTRPLLVNEQLVEGLNLVFREGEIVEVKADKGKEAFLEYINTDQGAKRLGEVALVGIDSPVYRSGLVFREILFDENAACHIAIGSAYKFCIKGGETMQDAELAEIGCNESLTHTDMMISDESVDVYATTYEHPDKEVPLILHGEWIDALA